MAFWLHVFQLWWGQYFTDGKLRPKEEMRLAGSHTGSQRQAQDSPCLPRTVMHNLMSSNTPQPQAQHRAGRLRFLLLLLPSEDPWTFVQGREVGVGVGRALGTTHLDHFLVKGVSLFLPELPLLGQLLLQAPEAVMGLSQHQLQLLNLG